MSLLYALKPLKDRALQSASRRLQKAGITPNMVTATGMILSVAAALLAASGNLHAGIFVFLLGACLDAVDGSFARACGLCSEFGRYFDSACDRLSELVFVVAAIAGGASVLTLAVVAGSFALMAARIYNHRQGLNSNAACFGRPERLTLLIAGLLVPAPFGGILFLAAGFLCGISVIQVLLSGKKLAGRKVPEI